MLFASLKWSFFVVFEKRNYQHLLMLNTKSNGQYGYLKTLDHNQIIFIDIYNENISYYSKRIHPKKITHYRILAQCHYTLQFAVLYRRFINYHIITISELLWLKNRCYTLLQRWLSQLVSSIIITKVSHVIFIITIHRNRRIKYESKLWLNLLIRSQSPSLLFWC